MIERNYEAIDLVKIIMSVFVVAIHTELFPDVLSPWTRIAVPVFFMISSYFFFNKLQSVGTKGSAVLRKFLIRNLQLYFFWFILLLPFTIIIRDYFQNGFWTGVYEISLDFLFSSTFRGSWYIIALCISVIVVYYLSKFLSTNVILFITLPIYLICCLFSNYYTLIDEFDLIVSGYENYISVFQSLVTSYPVALFWIALGKKISEKEYHISHKQMVVIALPLCILLYLEYLFIQNIGNILSNDCYVLLILLCPVIFIYIKDLKISIKHHYHLRKLSTVIYCLHATIASIFIFFVRTFLEQIHPYFCVINFLITLMTCVAVYILIEYFKKSRFLSFLKYSY